MRILFGCRTIIGSLKIAFNLCVNSILHKVEYIFVILPGSEFVGRPCEVDARANMLASSII